MHAPGLDRTAQRGARPEQARLTHDLVERARAHAFGQRLQRAGFGEQTRGGRRGGGTARHRRMISQPLARPCAAPDNARQPGPIPAMNYRHAFHAGNFADVFKHVVLLGLLDALRAKPAAFCYVDTHAGRGRYDLAGAQAQRTGEYRDGVARVLAAPDLPAALADYAQRIRAFGVDAAGTLLHYPGSPLLARGCLREQDRAILCELQPEEAAALRASVRGDARIAVHERDGYAALKALLPPAQKRGLVLIDPPFEAQGAEFDSIRHALASALARWPNAIHAVWYPIKLRETVAPFQRWLANLDGHADALVSELLLHEDNSPVRLNGCGMAIINPPWQFDRALAQWLPALARVLTLDSAARWRVDWCKR